MNPHANETEWDSMKILLAEDERRMADALLELLRQEGYDVDWFANGAEALLAAQTNVYDALILDVMLPGSDGFAITSALRREGISTPILMLTARVEDMDKIMGLTIGADDYITKPLHPLEMVARVKAQLRRYTRYNQGPKHNSQLIDLRGLTINNQTHECSLFGEPLSLTPIEFSILWLLCENAGRVISSEELFETVWGDKYLDSNNTVMVHIRRIREKIEINPKEPKYLKVVWGIGYKIEKL